MSKSAPNWARSFVIAACCLAVDAPAQLKQLPAGITMTSGELSLEVTALRDDVLGYGCGKATAAPEDASWAVLRRRGRAVFRSWQSRGGSPPKTFG